MATKGPSNRYGNTRGSKNKRITKDANYEYAKSFMQHDLKGHYYRHCDSVGAVSKEDYENRAFKFANTIDKKNCRTNVDYRGTTYKYNIKTKELAIITKKGTIVSYYKVSNDKCRFGYFSQKGKKKWVKI